MDPDVNAKFDTYPANAREKLLQIRMLIFEIAKEYELGEVTETLKWGEPSYFVRKGSPIRFDWKSAEPKQVSLFVNCNTRLVETYKEVYGNILQCVGKRQVIFALNKPLPEIELRGCIKMALQYHELKKFPMLGA